METSKPISNLPLIDVDDLLQCLNDTGVNPLPKPRELSRRAAVQALRHIYGHAIETEEVDHDLRIACRLLATIATINGSWDDPQH